MEVRLFHQHVFFRKKKQNKRGVRGGGKQQNTRDVVVEWVSADLEFFGTGRMVYVQRANEKKIQRSHNKYFLVIINLYNRFFKLSLFCVLYKSCSISNSFKYGKRYCLFLYVYE